MAIHFIIGWLVQEVASSGLEAWMHLFSTTQMLILPYGVYKHQCAFSMAILASAACVAGMLVVEAPFATDKYFPQWPVGIAGGALLILPIVFLGNITVVIFICANCHIRYCNRFNLLKTDPAFTIAPVCSKGVRRYLSFMLT